MSRRALLLTAATAGTSVFVLARMPSGRSLQRLAAPGAAAPGAAVTAGVVVATTVAGVATSAPTPSPTPSPTRRPPSVAALAAYDRTRPGEVAVSAVNLATGRSIAYRATSTFVTASVVKVDILVTLLLAAQSAGRNLTSSETSRCRAMITRSDNDAATSLWNAVGGEAAVARTHRRLGLTDTVPGSGGYWGSTRTTTRDRLRLLRALTDARSPLGAARRRLALELMSDVVADQRWGVSAASPGAAVALKNGWLSTETDAGLWTVNSTGHVLLPGGDPALVAVLSRKSPSLATGIATVERLARLTAAEIGR